MQPSAVPLGFPVTIVRADGRQLTFEKPVQRIVSLSPGHTEVLFAIDAGDRIVAVGKDSDLPPEVEGKTKFDTGNLDVEAVAELEPDLVVIMAGPEEVVRSLDQMGLRVLWLALPDSVQSLFDQIDVLGEVTGLYERSDALVESMDTRMLAVFDKARGPQRGPRVYHELDDRMTTASVGTFIGDLYLMLNADSIAGESPEAYQQMTLETIAQKDPDVIIVAHDETAESVKGRPGWAEIAAVKNGRVYAVDPDIVNRPGPRLAEGLETLAHLLYPDIFPAP